MDGYPDLQSVLRRLGELQGQQIKGENVADERERLERIALANMREGRVYLVKHFAWREAEVAYYRVAGVLHAAVAEDAMAIRLRDGEEVAA